MTGRALNTRTAAATRPTQIQGVRNRAMPPTTISAINGWKPAADARALWKAREAKPLPTFQAITGENRASAITPPA